MSHAATVNKAGIDITNKDISVCHRLPTRDSAGNKPKAIIIKFTRRDVRNHVIRQKKEMRENDAFKASYPEAFMVEHLTPLRGKAAYLIRNDTNIAKSWSIDGRLKIFKQGYTETDKPININSLQDLTQLGWSQDRIDDLMLKK